MKELKPCPFCGGKKIRMYSKRDNSVHGFMHICEGFDEPMVKVESRFFSTEEEAIEAWNRRLTDDKHSEET